MRRIFIILILILIIGAAGWLGYLVWQKLNNADTSVQQQIKTDEGKTVAKEEGLLKQITENSIANFWVNATTSEIFLINYDGEIEKLENYPPAGGTKTLASDNGLKNVSQITPSPDGSKALINLTIFDTATNIWTPLPVGATAAAWQPNNLPTISYLTNDGLYNLNLKDGKTSLVLKLNNRDWQISWPFADEIYLTEKPSSVYNATSWKVNLKDKTLTRGDWGLKKIADMVNLEYLIPGKKFNILPSKCLLVEKGFYCAVPSQEDVTLDDYLKRKVYTNDDIYFVSVDTEKKKAQAKLLLRANDNNPIDAINLALYKDKLLFINRYDQKLYSLELK
ncbi:MAG: hypothetical protein AAB847_00620 [Patescibacteria group bacterium]